jgi:hypothetical protein
LCQLSKYRSCAGQTGCLLVGLGAVSTTIAGVFAIRKGLSQPIGSLTQMGTIRLGKRTEGAPGQRGGSAVRAGRSFWRLGSSGRLLQCREAAGVIEQSLLDKVHRGRADSTVAAVFDQHRQAARALNIRREEQARPRRAGDRGYSVQKTTTSIGW